MRAREGFFQAATELVHESSADAYSIDQIHEIRNWFGQNLSVPDRFSRSDHKGYGYKETKGLSWFKPSAKQHISRAFEMKNILDSNGFKIDVLKEKRIGYVLYEDEYQVVAEPFSDTET